MRLPFTIPKVKELDGLSDDERKSLLSRYARSEASERAVSKLKMLLFLAIGFFLAGGVSLGFIHEPLLAQRPLIPIAIVCFALGFFSVIAALNGYRWAAQRAIRAMISQASR